MSTINKELSLVTERLKKFEMFFKELKCLEHFSPKRNRTTLVPDHIPLNMPSSPN